MYCSKCGAFLPEGAEVCPGCNAPVSNQSTTTNNSAANNQAASGGVYYTPQQSRPEYTNVSGTYNEQATNNQGSYYTNLGNNHNTNESYNAEQSYFMQEQIKENLSTANTLGIIAIVLGILVSSIIGIICGAIGLDKAKSIPDMPMDSPIAKEKAKVKKLNILGIVLPIALRALMVIMYVVFFMILGFSTIAYMS